MLLTSAIGSVKILNLFFGAFTIAFASWLSIARVFPVDRSLNVIVTVDASTVLLSNWIAVARSESTFLSPQTLFVPISWLAPPAR